MDSQVNTLYELNIQITSQVNDYVTELAAVNLRFKRIDNVSDLT